MRTPSFAPTVFLRYPAAVGFTTAALLARLALDPWLEDAHPLSLQFGAVALAMWIGGLGPALLATVLGYFASDYLLIEPRGVFAIATPRQLISLVIYLVSCAIIIAFAEGMRSANRRAATYAATLEAKQQELERAERRKDVFLATLGHELRNPLAAVRNALQLLRITRPGESGSVKAVEIADRQVRHMTRIVDDLLDVARIAEGRMHLQKEHIAVATALGDAIEAARPAIDAAGHALLMSLPADELIVHADRTRLAQIFLNLLNNATKYTPAGGHIWISARREAGQIAVTVRDDGIGIPEALLPRVFDLFAQFELAPERTQGGLGIGLTLVHRLVSMHAGSVEARSEGEGRGSEFTVRLPERPSSAAYLLDDPAPCGPQRQCNAARSA